MAVLGEHERPGDHWVDAGPFRAQLRYLMASGSLSVDDVAAIAGISSRLADRLLHGRNGRPLRRISSDTARRLIQVSDQHVQALRRIMVPAAQASLHLHRLYRAGWENLAIAQRVRVAAPELVELAAGADTCSLLLTVRLAAAARAAESLHYRRRLSSLPPRTVRPSRTVREHAA
jgi:hypothetical protein